MNRLKNVVWWVNIVYLSLLVFSVALLFIYPSIFKPLPDIAPGTGIEATPILGEILGISWNVLSLATIIVFIICLATFLIKPRYRLTIYLMIFLPIIWSFVSIFSHQVSCIINRVLICF